MPYIFKVICTFDAIAETANGVAIVRGEDYKYKININKFSYLGLNAYPYEMINYQKADLIVEMNPRLPAVGVCLNHVTKVYNGIIDWVKFHEIFKVAKIIMHDGSLTRNLRHFETLLNTKLVEIRDFKFKFSEICETEQIKSFYFKHPLLYPFYYRTCKRFYKRKFSNYDGNHNHLSANDCFTSFSYIYEFVTLYDLDELIIPRPIMKNFLC